MPVINLPTLYQKVRIDTKSMVTAEKRAQRFGATFDTELGKAKNAYNELNSAQQEYGETAVDIEKVNRSTGRSFRELFKPMRKTRNEAKDVEKEIKGAGNGMRRTGRDTDRFGKKFWRLTKAFIGFRALKMAAMFTGIAGAIGQVPTILTAATAAVLGWSAAIAPAVGVLGTIVPLVGSLGVAFAGMKLITGGFALEKPTKSVAAFNKNIKGTLKLIEQWKRSAADSFLLGFGNTLTKIINPAIKHLNPLVQTVSKDLGKIAATVTKQLLSRKMIRLFEEFVLTSEQLLKPISMLVKPFTEIFLRVGIAAAPAAETLALAIGGIADNLNKIPRNDMEKFFNRATSVFMSLSGSIWDFAKGLGRLSGIANNALFGRSGVINGLREVSARFAEWTGSKEGRKQIADFFHKLKPVVDALGRLFKTIGSDFLKMATDPRTAALIDSIRVDLLPVFESIIQKAGDALPGILNFIGGLAAVIDDIPFDKIGELADTMGDILHFADAFIDKAGPLALAFGGLLLARTVSKNIQRVKNLLSTELGQVLFPTKMGARGSSPLNPIFVSVVGGMPGGGGPTVFPGGNPGAPFPRKPTKWDKFTGKYPRLGKALGKIGGLLKGLDNFFLGGLGGLLLRGGGRAIGGFARGIGGLAKGVGKISPLSLIPFSLDPIRDALNRMRGNPGPNNVNNIAGGPLGPSGKGSFSVAPPALDTGLFDKSLQEFISRVSSTFGSNIPGLIARSMPGILGAVAGPLSRLPGIGSINFGGLIRTAGTFLSQLPGIASRWFSSFNLNAGTILNRMPSIVQRGIGGIPSIVGGVFRTALGNITGLNDDMLTAGWNLVGNLIQGIRNHLPDLSTWAATAAKIWRDHWPFSPAKTGPLRVHPMEKAGENLMSGLATGVMRQESAVQNAVKAAADGITGATRGRARVTVTPPPVGTYRAGQQNGRQITNNNSTIFNTNVYETTGPTTADSLSRRLRSLQLIGADS